MTSRHFRKLFVSGVIAVTLIAGGNGAAVASDDYAESIRRDIVPQVREWLANPAVVAAIAAQNQENASLSQAQVDALDKQWRAETNAAKHPLIDRVLGNDLSGYLGQVKSDGQGIYTEIFVMDAKGLNVGQSDLTSDYWQGDEAKWQKTYLAGASSMLIDKVEFDESTQTFQSQLSLPVVDPASGAVIGAVTVGVNVDLLQ